MKVVFVRHGEADYTPCAERNFIGHGRDLAPLSELGLQQAHAAAGDSRLAGAELLLSSPYTRALQTAAVIACRIGLEPLVEIDLHEWMPDLTFQFRSVDELKAISGDFGTCHGLWPTGQKKRWEQRPELFKRACAVLDRYAEFHRIIVVTHGMVMRTFANIPDIPNCGIVEIEYSPGYEISQWISD